MPLEKIINSALKFLDIKLTQLGDKIVSAFPKNESADLKKNINIQTKLLSSNFSKSVKQLETAINKIKDPKFTGEIMVDTVNLEKELREVVSDLKSSIKPVKLGNVESALKMIHTALKDNSKVQSKSFKDGLGAIAEALNQLNLVVPDTFKLDAMQLRALKPQGNASSIYGGVVPARNTKITNKAMATANTQYSHTFNKSCVSFRMKMRAQNVSFNYSWATGTLKVSGDASEYISIPANWLDSRDSVEYNGKIIYFESSSSSQTMEIEENIA